MPYRNNILLVVFLRTSAVALILTLNGLLFACVVFNAKLRQNVNHVLLLNVLLVNAALGATISVGDPEITRTAALINSFVTVATLITLTTHRLSSILHRRSTDHMGRVNMFKLIIAIWTLVFGMSVCKCILSYYFYYERLVCDICMSVFETTSLIAFTLVALILYAATSYSVAVRKNRTIYDHSTLRSPQTVNLINIREETKVNNTVGLLLLNYVALFAVYGVAEALTFDEDVETAPLVVLGNVALYAKCLITPVIIMFRDDEVNRMLLRLLSPSSNRRATVDLPILPGDDVSL